MKNKTGLWCKCCPMYKVKDVTTCGAVPVGGRQRASWEVLNNPLHFVHVDLFLMFDIDPWFSEQGPAAVPSPGSWKCRFGGPSTDPELLNQKSCVGPNNLTVM